MIVMVRLIELMGLLHVQQALFVWSLVFNSFAASLALQKCHL